MYCDVRQWHHTRRSLLVASNIRRRILEKGIPKKRVPAETRISRKTINKMAIEALGKIGKSDIAAGSSRRSISASRNALAINVILKAAMTSPPRKLRELPAPQLRSHRRRSRIRLCNRSLL
jgi:hypothetical protein